MSRALFETRLRGEGVVSLQIATDSEPYLGPAWVHGFIAVLTRVGRDPATRAVILEGGARYFSAGASRSSLLATGGAGPGSYAAAVPRMLLSVDVPVIAAASGHAVGGGLLLALWCDATVLAEESLYGANFMALGFTPGMGATVAVEEAFGAPLGRELLFTGRLMTGREIRSAGCPISPTVRPRTEVEPGALALAGQMAEAPRPALALLKRTLARRRRPALERALTVEQANHARLFGDRRTEREIARRYPAPQPDERDGRP